MALGRKEAKIDIIFDDERFEQIRTQIDTLIGEVSNAVEELNKAREAIVKERKTLAREIRRLEAAQRR